MKRKYLPTLSICLWIATLILVSCGGSEPELTDSQILATADAIRTLTPTSTPTPQGRYIKDAYCDEDDCYIEYDYFSEEDIPLPYEEDYPPDTLSQEDYIPDPAQFFSELCPYTNRDSNLRAGPGTNYPVIGFAPKDSCIPVDGRNTNGTWLVFHDDKEFGAGVHVWIAASLIEDEPQDLPVLTAQAAPAASLQEAAPANASAPDCYGGCTEYPTWCAPPIKGNISQNTGEKIYHLPGQEYYDATNISPDYGERWFCTEDEATAAGWRRSKQ